MATLLSRLRPRISVRLIASRVFSSPSFKPHNSLSSSSFSRPFLNPRAFVGYPIKDGDAGGGGVSRAPIKDADAGGGGVSRAPIKDADADADVPWAPIKDADADADVPWAPIKDADADVPWAPIKAADADVPWAPIKDGAAGGGGVSRTPIKDADAGSGGVSRAPIKDADADVPWASIKDADADVPWAPIKEADAAGAGGGGFSWAPTEDPSAWRVFMRAVEFYTSRKTGASQELSVSHDTADDTKTELYQVYLGKRQPGDDASEIDSHIDLLTPLLGSKEAADESIEYSYSCKISGFGAMLTALQAKRLAEFPNVVSVLPCRCIVPPCPVRFG